MMKIFVALAVIAIAVSAETYNYTVPKLPCAYQLIINQTKDGKSKDLTKMAVNDHFLRSKVDLNDIFFIYRPDITTLRGDRKMIGIAVFQDEECQSDWEELDGYLKFFDGLYDSLFADLNSISWNNKTDCKYNGKACTCYLKKATDMILYVYDDYPYVIRQGTTEQLYEWEWDAPLNMFKLEDCFIDDFGKTPKEKYSKCYNVSSSSSSDVASSTQAYGAVVFAVIAASLVALF